MESLNIPDDWGVNKYERDSHVRIKFDHLTPENKIALIRDVVNQHQYQKIKSSGKSDIIDGTTANVIIKVYDAITNPETKRKFASKTYHQMANISWGFVK